MNSTFSSAMKLRTSSALLNDINPPCAGRAYVGLTWLSRRYAVWTVVVRNFRLVSPVFHQCYACSVSPACSPLAATPPADAARPGGSGADTVVVGLNNPGTRAGTVGCGWRPLRAPEREVLR